MWLVLRVLFFCDVGYFPPPKNYHRQNNKLPVKVHLSWMALRNAYKIMSFSIGHLSLH
jgi:hypothetical protein